MDMMHDKLMTLDELQDVLEDYEYDIRVRRAVMTAIHVISQQTLKKEACYVSKEGGARLSNEGLNRLLSRIPDGSGGFVDSTEGHSQRDLEHWLESPFWKAFVLLLKAQIGHNVRDLTTGDISVREGQQEGLVYRNDDMLRGGILAMSYIVHNIPEVLSQELLEANEAARRHLIQEEKDAG